MTIHGPVAQSGGWLLIRRKGCFVRKAACPLGKQPDTRAREVVFVKANRCREALNRAVEGSNPSGLV